MKEICDKSLYTPELEHDACGIGFVAHLKGQKSHKIVEDAIIMLQNMEHRGACGCDPNTGDGAGILVQKPHKFFVEKTQSLGIVLPDFNEYGVGMIFFPKDETLREACRQILNGFVDKLGMVVLGYRQVPTNNHGLGESSKSVEHEVEQVFVKFAEGNQSDDPLVLERKLFILKSIVTHTIRKQIPEVEDSFYIPSCSYNTIVYKGQLITYQVRPYYPDIQDPLFESALAVVHSRFSTNTFPKWKLAQPFRYIAHNGEINTIRGNVNWMKSKEALLETSFFTKEELDMLLPICNVSRSDSANLDNIIELLYLGGRSLPHVMMMVIPEAWQDNEMMEDPKKAFYEYHATLMEPWDGPASISFTDGNMVGATLDRNGLRPSRYLLTEDDILIMSSEAGSLPVDESKVLMKGRLQPGKMFVADLEQGRIISDEELKKDICSAKPYRDWLDQNKKYLDDLPQPQYVNGQLEGFAEIPLRAKQITLGYTSEDLKVVLGPMAVSAKEPIGSMGIDTPLAVLSNQSQDLSYYFKQLFAQVSNPPIDPIRERMVMSLFTSVGSTMNILDAVPDHCKQIHMSQPVLTNDDLKKLRYINHPDYKVKTIYALFEADHQPGRLEEAIDRINSEAEAAVREGTNILIISDKGFGKQKSPIPSLLATGAIHHHLINKGMRAKTGLVIETGFARETHQFATLIGYGAHAVNPYVAFESIADLKERNLLSQDLPEEKLVKNYIKGINYGLLKIFSKMGISTLQSYHGAQIFEALGISRKVVDKCFNGTISRIEGVSFDDIAKEALVRHKIAFPDEPTPAQNLEVGGFYQWKRRGEKHLFNPQTIHLLQHSTKRNDYNLYKKYARLINDQTKAACTLRGLLDFNKKREPVLIEEVESKESIFKRFATGAMSFGSISHEAHSTLAIAMNRIGGKSNSGEGGEDEIRFERKANGDWERSAIKQVASGRFGVTSNYLTNSVELQIKIAQGAKPGEGGQLPGHKVDEWIGRVRHSTPGVGLISPPPHHDIYSIEDLAQLIFDLKNANREARINVKLVASAGVGTIAAGVAKAHADVILISGHDGGTGASPISSIRHAGVPWELGLSESHQTLVKNDLRSRVTLQADGQMKTGRDLAIAVLLGAEEFGVATAALVVEGCIMMRKCHLNTCPVGVATQDPSLRAMFTGDADHVVNLFHFLAEDLREIMAELGFRTINEMVGQTDMLSFRKDVDHWKYKNLDLSPILYKEQASDKVGLFKQIPQDHGIDKVLDWKMLEVAKPALEREESVEGEFHLLNTDRAVGTLVSNEISKRYGSKGLCPGTITFKYTGSAGQSFAAFGAPGIRFEVEGEANDYFGKGLSGSELVIYPPKESKFSPSENMIIGNVAFYGATSGEAYIRGLAGERFCVRNSGATTVVEGVGDHGCEYMTGGIVVVLGETGRNFAAGMSGGVAYVYDPDKQFHKYCNTELVELEALEEENVQLLNQLIYKHYRNTNSDVAESILKHWHRELYHFVKVMPIEYKAVLLKRKAAKGKEESLNKAANKLHIRTKL